MNRPVSGCWPRSKSNVRWDPPRGPKEESQCVDRFGRRQAWASPGMGVVRFGLRQVWASPGLSVARFGHRKVEASPTLRARPVILRVCFGTDGDTPQYPQVGNTVEGASSERPRYGRGGLGPRYLKTVIRERERWLQGHIPNTSRE